MESRKPKSMRPLSIIFRLLFSFLLLSILFIAFVPSILSKPWGKEKLLGWVNQQIPGQIEVNSFSFSWLGPQKIEGVRLKDSEGSEIFTFESATAPVSLFRLIKEFSPGDFNIDNFNATLIIDALSGVSNLENALKKDCCTSFSSSLAQTEPIFLKNVYAHVNLRNAESPFLIQISGKTEHGLVAGEFKIEGISKGVSSLELLKGNFNELFSSETGLMFNAEIRKLPVTILDQLLGYKFPKLNGMLSQIIGNQLNVSINQKHIPKGSSFIVEAGSSNIAFSTTIDLTDQFTLSKPATLSLSLSPEMIQSYVKEPSPFKEGQRSDTLNAKLVINELKFPLSLLENKALDLNLVTLEATITEFPLNILDHIWEMEGLLTQSIGSKLNASIALNPDEMQQLAIVSMHSDRLNIPQILLHVDKKISLKKPVEATLQFSSVLVNSLLPEQLRLKKNALAKLTFHEFVVPFPDINHSFSLEQIHMKVDLAVSPMQIAQSSRLGDLNVDDFLVNLNIKTLSKTECAVKAIFSQPEDLGLISQMLGKKSVMNLQGVVDLRPEYGPLLEKFHLQLSSDQLHATIGGEIAEGNQFFVTSPAIFSYQIGANTLQAMGLEADHYQFEQLKPLKFTINAAEIPIKGWNFSLLHLSGQLNVEELTVHSKESRGFAQAIMRDLTGRWIVDGNLGRMKMEFEGLTSLGKQQAEGKISGTVAVEHLFNKTGISLDKTEFKGHFTTHKLPTQFISTLTNNYDLVSLIGPSLNATLALDFSFHPTRKGKMTLNLESERLFGNAEFLLDDSLTLMKNHPAEFRFNLTPNGYSALRQIFQQASSSDFNLANSSIITLTLKEFHLPFNRLNYLPDYLSSSLDAELVINQLTGIDKKTEQKIILENIFGRIKSSKLSEQFSYELKGKGKTSLHGSTFWEIGGVLNKGFLPDGSLNKNLSFTLDTHISSLPISLLCQILCLDSSYGKKIDAIFGPTLDAKFNTHLKHMHGPILVDLKGKNGHLNLDAAIENGILTLNKDLIIEVAVTTEFVQHVLQEIIPITNGMLNADQPLKLTIASEGFILPIHNFSKSNLTISNAKVELGKVYFSSQSQLSKILSLLFSSRDQLLVWITPTYFSLKNGTIHLERVDLLINEGYPLATWGNVDLSKEKVNMIIGLTGTALAKAFNLTEIPHNYMLQLPLKGPLKGPSIDKAKATARISALVAQNQGGPHGAVLGTVLDIASGSLTEEPVPQSRTNPLPWAELLQNEKNSTTKEPSTKEEKRSSTLEEISKEAGSFIKKIFKS
jgi:hypothetical protein